MGPASEGRQDRPWPQKGGQGCNASWRPGQRTDGGGLWGGWMKDNLAFLDALQQIAKDKGISVDVLLDALANALVAAYKRMPGAAEEAVVTIEADSGEIRV